MGTTPDVLRRHSSSLLTSAAHIWASAAEQPLHQSSRSPSSHHRPMLEGQRVRSPSDHAKTPSQYSANVRDKDSSHDNDRRHDKKRVSYSSDRLAKVNSQNQALDQEDQTTIIQGDRKTPGAHVRMTLLPVNFAPGAGDVLCGRGKSCKMWVGNVNYRRLVEEHLEEYAAAPTKLEKGFILSRVVDQIRKNSPSGGFVKQDADTKRWYEVGDFLAREKTSQCFRDALHEQYSSSAQAKYKRRKVAGESARQQRKNSSCSSSSSSTSEKDAWPDQEVDEPLGGPSHHSQQPVMLPKQAEKPQLEVRRKLATSPNEGSLDADTLTGGGNKPQDRNDNATRDGVSTNEQTVERCRLERRPSEDAVANVLHQMAVSHYISPSKEVMVCALQLASRQRLEHPLQATQRVLSVIDMAVERQEEKVDLFLLPELCPVGYSEDTFAKFLPKTPELKQMYREIDNAMAAKARSAQATICYGTIGWEEASDEEVGDAFFIRQVVVDRTGQVVASYDKIHLSDYGAYAETRFFTPGPSRPVSFSIGDFQFGILIGEDIRNPDLPRKLARNHHADVLLQPTALVRDITFRTWGSFRTTRAVENSCYFIATNYAGIQFGDTAVIPPWVDQFNEPLQLGTAEGFLLGKIERSVLTHVRQSMPFYRQLQSEKPATTDVGAPLP